MKELIQEKLKKNRIVSAVLLPFDMFMFVLFFFFQVGPTCPFIPLLNPFQPRNNLFCPGFNFIYPN